jgi:NADH dehydrogenase FAD-containing subunit
LSLLSVSRTAGATPGGTGLIPSQRTRLLLVGAGHTHLHLIDRAEILRRAGLGVTLIAPREFHYSGLATAVATGAMPAYAATIDVAALAARRGVHHLESRAVGCDPERRVVTLEGGGDVGYDVVSFNVGSVVATGALQIGPGVSAVKPFDRLFAFSTWLARTTPDRSYGISIVGGGPTGLELAGQLSARFRGRATVTIFDRQQAGMGLPQGARRRVIRILERRGVQLRPEAMVQTVERDHLIVDGARHEHDTVVIATGLTPTSFPCDSRLGDARGIPVRATLQHVDHDDIYAAGDTAHFTPQPLPKLGVHGVRQGPVLERSLLARQAGRTLPVYEPRRHALQILDLGGTALATRGRWWAEGPLLRQLKLAIDGRWLARYR